MAIITVNGEILDQIMGLTIPTAPTPESLYSADLSNDLLIIAAHTHTGENNKDGYQLDANSLNISQDIQFNNTNVGLARSLRLTVNGSNISGSSDVNSIYDVNGDLWFNDGNGDQIRLTEAGAIAPTAVSANLAYVGVTVNGTGSTPFIIPFNATYNLLNISTTSAAAIIVLPISSAVVANRYYYFNDIGNAVATNNITIEVAAGSGDTIEFGGVATSSVSLNTNNISGFIYTNATGKWYLTLFDQKYFTASQITYVGSNLNFIESSIIMDGNSGLSLPANIVNNNFASYTPTIECPINIGDGGSTNGQLNANIAGAIIVNAASALQVTSGNSIEIESGGEILFDVFSVIHCNPTFDSTSITAFKGSTTFYTSPTFINGASFTNNVSPADFSVTANSIELEPVNSFVLKAPSNNATSWIEIDGSVQFNSTAGNGNTLTCNNSSVFNGNIALNGTLNGGCIKLTQTSFTGPAVSGIALASYTDTTGSGVFQITGNITSQYLLSIPAVNGRKIIIDCAFATFSGADNWVRVNTPSGSYVTISVNGSNNGITVVTQPSSKTFSSPNQLVTLYCDGTQLFVGSVS